MSSPTSPSATTSSAPKRPRALEAAAEGARESDVEFHIYPGTDHAFFNDTRPEVYDPAAADAGLAAARSISSAPASG